MPQTEHSASGFGRVNMQKVKSDGRKRKEKRGKFETHLLRAEFTMKRLSVDLPELTPPHSTAIGPTSAKRNHTYQSWMSQLSHCSASDITVYSSTCYIHTIKPSLVSSNVKHTVRFRGSMLVCMLVAKIQESWCSFKHSQPLPTRPQTIAVKKEKKDSSKTVLEDVSLVELMYFVFTHMPGESYCRWLRSLLFICVMYFTC